MSPQAKRAQCTKRHCRSPNSPNKNTNDCESSFCEILCLFGDTCKRKRFQKRSHQMAVTSAQKEHSIWTELWCAKMCRLPLGLQLLCRCSLIIFKVQTEFQIGINDSAVKKTRVKRVKAPAASDKIIAFTLFVLHKSRG